MAVEILKLKPSPNWETMNRIRESASPDYQRRIPEATKSNIQSTVRAITEFRPTYNEFQDVLLNRIGSTVARNISWSNPLAEFKQGLLEYGNTIEEIQVGLIQSTPYWNDRESLEGELFGTANIDVDVNFHTVNRQEKYKITVNEAQLKRAFQESNGLTTFVSKVMEAPTTSDQWDEFILMCSLFALYESNGGFFKINVPDISNLASSTEDAQLVLKKLRASADTLTFLSSRYNAAHMPTFANRDDLLLFVTPEFRAAVDVDALAAAFNLEHTTIHGRVIPIPAEQFGIKGCQAILTTKDFFVVADQLLENTSQWNPAKLQTNYWLHHWEVLSASRFVPAIMFTTGPGDEIIQIVSPVTGITPITVEDREGVDVTEVERGELYQVNAAAIVAADADATNTGVRFAVTGNTSLRTFVTQQGVLHVSPTEQGSLVLRATTTWLDPANLMVDGKTTTLALTVTGELASLWPNQREVTGVTIQGVDVPAWSPTTYSYTDVNVPTIPVTVGQVDVHGPDAGDVVVSINGTGDVITIGAASAPGDPVYTITVV